MTVAPSAAPTWRRAFAHPDVATACFGVAVAVGVCWPVLGDRPLFLLDWVIGPRPPLPSPSMLGLDGGLTTGVVGDLVFTVLVRVIGEAATWLSLFAVFPIASVGVGRLTGGRLWPRLAAAALYCVNPWVFNRIYAGHLTLLLGYALLPFAVSSALKATNPARRPLLSVRGWEVPTSAIGPALWWAVLAAFAPHYAWIYGVVLVSVAMVTRRRRWWLVGWLVCCAAFFGVMSMYILLPHSVTALGTTVGTTSLDLYRTTPDPHLGLLPNVAALYGFWRLAPGPVLPKDVVTGWPLLMAALLVLVVAGFWAVLGHRRATSLTGLAASNQAVSAGADGAPGPEGPASPDPPTGDGDAERRRVGWLLVVVGVAGFFLALGSQGPTGALFHWAYDTVPFFDIMREPQKFLMLLVLAYAVGLGWGVQRLGRMKLSTRRAGWAVAAIGLALPLAYSPSIFDGLAGQIGPSTLPPAYQQANRLMGEGPGQVLYLPWHLYEVQPFTGGRVVASIASGVFQRTVVSGDNVQVGNVQTQSDSRRQAYLTGLLAKGDAIADFGTSVAPLGVEYVALAKTSNWHSYSWLEHQPDLRLVLDSGSLEVWRNLDFRGPGRRPGASQPVRQLSPVAYRVPPGPPGPVEIDAAYQPGWQLDGVSGQPSPEGTVEFILGRAGGVAQFRPWGMVKLGDVISGAAFAVLASALVWTRRRRRRRTRLDSSSALPHENSGGEPAGPVS